MMRTPGWKIGTRLFLRTRARVLATVVLATTALTAPLSAAVPAPDAAVGGAALDCAFTQMRLALKDSMVLNACFRRALSSGTGPDRACLDDANGKFQASFAKLEAKGGCAVAGNGGTIQVLVDKFALQLADAVNPATCLPSGSPCGNVLTPCCGQCVGIFGQQPVCS